MENERISAAEREPDKTENNHLHECTCGGSHNCPDCPNRKK